MDKLEAIHLFIEDGRELLSRFEDGLLQLGLDGFSKETVDDLFRSIHTLKGNAGVVGLDSMIQKAHQLEDLLDQLRKGALPWNATLQKDLLLDKDSLLKMLLSLESIENKHEYKNEKQVFKIKFPTNALVGGTDPLFVFSHVMQKLKDVEIRCIDEDLPLISQLNPEELHITFELRFSEPVDEDELVALLPEATEVKAMDSSLKSKRHELKDSFFSRTIRLDVPKLDRVVDLVGELVVTSASVSSVYASTGRQTGQEHFERLQSLVDQIREASLTLRMLPVGTIFQKFPRMVHELGISLGKKVRLELSGVDTQLDKSMAEKLYDPLTHLVRNAMDHGIESHELRVNSKKSEEAVIKMNASSEGNSIVVEVEDDGCGIDPHAVLRKALQKGLADPNQVYSDDEIFQFLFLPGFSTKENVSDISGRGVGLDVVMKVVRELRGNVELSSTVGNGSSFKIRLPLSLAIIDAFILYTPDMVWAIPLDQVVECVNINEVVLYRGVARIRGENLSILRLRNFQCQGDSKPLQERVVVVQGRKQHIGIVADRLGGQAQVVIKPMGPLFQNYVGINGTAILGNGQIAMVLDVVGLERLGGTKIFQERSL